MHGIDSARWKAMSPLLDQLLDADETQRKLQLEQIRVADLALARDIEGLLAQQAAANRHAFLDGSLLPMDSHGEGEVVGGYTLDSMIGCGGMASVWLARRSDGRFEGRAAIKFLHLSSLSERDMQRAYREGSLLASLSHPRIAHLLDAGLADNGQPYLVLEHVDGLALDAWCTAHASTAIDRVRVFVDVLSAVSHAHERRVLHRDLKPSNILVTSSGQVKLIDFGIAQRLSEDAPLGVEGVACHEAFPAFPAFTPDFAAPEQVQSQPLSIATDVYALGVLLYLLLTGVHPTALPGSEARERLRAVVEVEPVPLSVAARGAFGRDLERIVAKALNKSPGKRYASAGAMARDLQQYLRGELGALD